MSCLVSATPVYFPHSIQHYATLCFPTASPLELQELLQHFDHEQTTIPGSPEWKKDYTIAHFMAYILVPPSTDPIFQQLFQLFFALLHAQVSPTAFEAQATALLLTHDPFPIPRPFYTRKYAENYLDLIPPVARSFFIKKLIHRDDRLEHVEQGVSGWHWWADADIRGRYGKGSWGHAILDQLRDMYDFHGHVVHNPQIVVELQQLADTDGTPLLAEAISQAHFFFTQRPSYLVQDKKFQCTHSSAARAV